MISNEERYQKQLKQLQRQQKRARERAKSPEYREKQLKKANESRKRQKERQLEKLNAPDYQKKEREKAIVRQQKAIDKAKSKPKAKPKSSRGLKGRTALAAESKIQDAFGPLPCIACLVHGRVNLVASQHHIEGRTKPNAHKKIIPLCGGHHNVEESKEVREQYPDMIPIHAQGKHGGRAAWEALNGSQLQLLALTYALVNIEPEFPLPSVDAGVVEDIRRLL